MAARRCSTRLKRLDGRYIPDTQPDRMSEYEALRIHEYHDTTVAERVLRRWDTYGVTTLQPQPGELAAHGQHGGRRGADRPGDRGVPAGGHAHPHDARHGRARDERPRDGEGPQVRDPRLRGLHRGLQPARLQARQHGVAARERRHLLRERARSRRDADRHDRSVRAGPPGRGRGRLLRRGARRGPGRRRLAEDSGGFVVRNTNDLARASRGSRTRRRPTTCSATSPRTRRGTASSARSR